MSKDIFADIGTLSLSERREHLEEIKPPELPARLLPSGKSDPRAAFKLPAKIDTPEKLKEELARQRKRYAPFMKDLAPDLTKCRESIQLEDFQWRLETGEDQKDFQYTMNGKGEWTNIKIPHFGGPIGKAIAYYRTSFQVTPSMLSKGAVFIKFGAVDYKAHVFINGHYQGSHEGFFAPFEFECSKSLNEGENILLVKVENDSIFLGNHPWGLPEEGDKLYAATNLGWDDPNLGWSHCPPGFGIYQDVFIEARSPINICDLWVRPSLENESAEAWIEVLNTGRKNELASFEISVFGQNFRQTVIRKLKHTPGTRIIPGVGDMQKPTDNQDVQLDMGPGANLIKIPLHIPDPKIWELNTPWLYQIQVKLLDKSGKVIDAQKRQFGMRSFRQENTKIPRGMMFLNGKEIRLRGSNTMGFEQQDVFKKDFDQLIDDILLAKICNLNYFRLTQRPVQPEVYLYCDRLGLLTQSDLPLFGCLRYNKFAEALRQVEEMEKLIRGYACNIMISYINEPFPNASGKPHRHLTRPDLQAFFEAADRAVHVLNPERVIKHIDGDYDPPSDTLPDNHCYCGWYNGHGLELGKLHRGYWVPVKKEWMYACGEFGVEGLDFADLMLRRYPKEWLPGKDESLWSPDSIHGAQTGKFHYMWFDTQKTLEDWAQASQRHQAWIVRLFAERFRRDNRMASFAIHLFIDAFPASWMKTIMDCERKPKPAYFEYKEALEPLMVNIRTDRWKFTSGEKMPFEFWIFNDTNLKTKNYNIHWQIEKENKVIFSQKSRADIQAMKSTFQGFFIPLASVVEKRTKYILHLALAEGSKILRSTSMEYEVFPKIPDTGKISAMVFGKGKAYQLLKELGIKPVKKEAQVIFIDDFDLYKTNKKIIDNLVLSGAKAVFLELPTGKYEIGGSEVNVTECIMRAREFVSRATGHELVKGFEPDDFKQWYDPEAGYFRPLLPNVFDAEDWQPILMSGNGVWGKSAWEKSLAAAEKKSGKGSYIVCQVKLAGRVIHNPVAKIFAHRLLDKEL
jgi:hypothetical protein